MNTGKTLFAQLMDFLPWTTFTRIVDRYGGDHRVRTLSCAEQYRSMAFAQLTYRESLGDIETCLSVHASKLYHMGFRQPVRRSTLADANERRDWRIHAALAQRLITQARTLYVDEELGLDLTNTVYALDSTTIALCLSVFPWAHFRTTKAAVKMHTLLDLRGNIPSFIHISDGKLHDVHALDMLLPEAGAIYVVDRGYVDFARLYVLHQAGAFFVTRAKSNIDAHRVYSAPTDRSTGIICDQTISLDGFYTRQDYPELLRRIRFKDPESGKTLVFITNNFSLPAATICALYKSRWQVELFFKWIKQHLRIKQFYGTSENAVKTQIWIAVSVYVLVAIVKKWSDPLKVGNYPTYLTHSFRIPIFKGLEGRVEMAKKGPGRAYREGLTIVQLMDMFPTEAAAVAWFESVLWSDGERHCGKCGSIRTREVPNAKPMPYWCTDCRGYFSVRTGTPLARSNVPMRKWVIAIYLCLTSLKSVSSMKLSRDIGVKQETAWFMLHRIREAWNDDTDDNPFDGPVEVDETYFGGKRRNMSNAKRKELSDTGRGTVGKTAVVGMKDRDTKQVRAEVVAETDSKTLQDFVEENTEDDATVYTDDAAAYKGVERAHEAVRHSVSEYVNGMAHTNGIESFWSILKRAHKGTFHKMSPKHLQRYVSEFAGKHNIRDSGTLVQMRDTVARLVGRNLLYRDLIRPNGLSSGARS